MTATLRTAPNTARLSTASALQALLAELVALSLHAKQAHWNVTGPGFLPLHALTDRIADDLRSWADRVAERAVALGFSVDARPGTISATTGPFPAGRVTDHEVIDLLAELIHDVAIRAQGSLGDLNRDDAVAYDLTVEIVEGLDKYRWMLQAQAL